MLEFPHDILEGSFRKQWSGDWKRRRSLNLTMFYRIHLPQGPKKIWCNIKVASNDYKDVIKMLQRCYKDVALIDYKE